MNTFPQIASHLSDKTQVSEVRSLNRSLLSLHFRRKESVFFGNIFCFSDLSPTRSPISQEKLIFSDFFITFLTLDNYKARLDPGPSFKFRYAAQHPGSGCPPITCIYYLCAYTMNSWPKHVQVMQLSVLANNYMEDIGIQNSESGVL